MKVEMQNENKLSAGGKTAMRNFSLSVPNCCPAIQLLNSIPGNTNPLLKSECIPWRQQNVPSGFNCLCGHSQETYVFFLFIFSQLISWVPEIAQSYCKFSDLIFSYKTKCWVAKSPQSSKKSTFKNVKLCQKAESVFFSLIKMELCFSFNIWIFA